MAYIAVKNIGFGFFIEWHINLRELLNAKATLIEEDYWYNLTNSRSIKEFMPFPRVITQK